MPPHCRNESVKIPELLYWPRVAGRQAAGTPRQLWFPPLLPLTPRLGARVAPRGARPREPSWHCVPRCAAGSPGIGGDARCRAIRPVWDRIRRPVCRAPLRSTCSTSSHRHRRGGRDSGRAHRRPRAGSTTASASCPASPPPASARRAAHPVRSRRRLPRLAPHQPQPARWTRWTRRTRAARRTRAGSDLRPSEGTS